MSKEFQMFDESQEITTVTPAPAKEAGEEEHEEHEEQEEHQEAPPEEGAEKGAEPGKEKPAAQPKPKPKEEPLPDDPAALKRMLRDTRGDLGRQRRAHQREVEIAELRGRNKVLEELVTKGVRLPGEKGDGGKPAGEADGFVYTVPRPTRDTFQGSETEYEDAVADWRDGQREAQRAYDARQTQEADVKKKGDQLFEKMHTAALTRYPDYDDKIAESKEAGIQVNAQVAQAVAQLGGRYMPDLIYYFATHPEEVAKINASDDPIAAVEDLRDTLALEQRQSGKPRKTLPNPPPKLPGDEVGPAGGNDEFDPKLSTERRIELGKARRAREAAGKT